MNPLIYAYAEIEINEIRIKIINSDAFPIPINYNTDEFYLITEEDKYALFRGDREKYANSSFLKPNESIEFNLELPTNFLDTIGMTNPQSHNANYSLDFWKGQNTLNIIKEKITHIEVNIGDNLVIILKPIPENKK